MRRKKAVKLIESLTKCAEDMLNAPVELSETEELVKIEVPA
jgi:hypothetical protein